MSRRYAGWQSRGVDDARPPSGPLLRQTVLDAPDPRRLAEFYRALLGLDYRPGDAPPDGPGPDERGRTWLVLVDATGPVLAFQAAPGLPEPTWPQGPRPQMLHLDIEVASREELDVQHGRVLELGGRLLDDRGHDPVEAVRVYADPAGHPFCLYVDAGS